MPAVTLPEIDFTVADQTQLTQYQNHLKNLDLFLEMWQENAAELDPQLQLIITKDNSRTSQPTASQVAAGYAATTSISRADHFVFYLPPAMRFLRLFEQNFYIPFPAQYITLTISFAYSQAQMHCSARTFHGFAEDYYNLADIKYCIGSFLPNHSYVGQYCDGTGAMGFYTSLHTKDGDGNIFNKVSKWFGEISGKNHNGDWYDYLFLSHAWYVMARDLDVDLTQIPAGYYDQFINSIKEIKTKDFAYRGKGQVTVVHCPPDVWLRFMRQLEKEPDFWTRSNRGSPRLKNPVLNENSTVEEIGFANYHTMNFTDVDREDKKLGKSSRPVIQRSRKAISQRLKLTEAKKKATVAA